MSQRPAAGATLRGLRFALALAFALQTRAQDSVKPCPVASTTLASRGGEGTFTVTFQNDIDEEISLFWIDSHGKEVPQGTILPLAETTRESYGGHAFRVRQMGGARETLVETVMEGAKRKIKIRVGACGALAAIQALPPASPRAAEFEALLHDLGRPCSGPSRDWSCVRYLHADDLRTRDPEAYGIQPNETHARRWYTTVDHTYVDQINRIPKVTAGPGYAKMSFTQPMHDALTEWYAARRHDSMKPHGVIPGGYTNNDHVLIDKVNLDHFPETHGAVLREMREILQWWTGLRLKHTSTFGVRVYRRGSSLIDHVDRMDTHLASAVIQIDQRVDADGGWPLELLLPNRTVAEVYTQPGEIILYEGAWLRHGRPMRFKGDEFANVFSHFAPPDWHGAHRSPSESRGMYYGVPPDRLTTLADDGYRKSTDFAPLQTAAAETSHDEL
jgi:hypothetical protein